MQNLNEQFNKYNTIYNKFETNLKNLSKYDKGDQSIKEFSSAKLDKVLNLEQQFNNVLLKRYDTFAENPQQDPLFKDGAYKDVLSTFQDDGTSIAFKYIILDTMNMFNVWYDQICYNPKIQKEIHPLQRLKSDIKYAQSFEAFYDEANQVFQNLDKLEDHIIEFKQDDKNLISALAKNDKCSSWEYLTQVVAPSYLEQFIKPSVNTNTKHLRETLAATLDTHLINKRTYKQTRQTRFDSELTQKMAQILTPRPPSPDRSVSSLSDDGSTTGPDDDSIGSNSPRSTSSKSSNATKNTGNTTSSDNSKRSSVLERAGLFGETVQRGGAPSKGPKGPKNS